MTTQQQIDYGVRTFDLSEPRTLERINIRADNIAILRADDSSELRINSPEAAPVDPRELSGIRIRNEDDPRQAGIQRIYISNDSGTGLLRILTGFGGTAGMTDMPTGDEVDIINREARELGKIRVQDSNGVLVDPIDAADTTPISDDDTGVGTGGAAQLELGQYRQSVNIHAETNGAATLTVEVSPDGGNSWLTFDTVDYDVAIEQVEAYPNVAFTDIRAYLDANRVSVTIAAKGV